MGLMDKMVMVAEGTALCQSVKSTLLRGTDFWSFLAILQTGLNETLPQSVVYTTQSGYHIINKTFRAKNLRLSVRFVQPCDNLVMFCYLTVSKLTCTVGAVESLYYFQPQEGDFVAT